MDQIVADAERDEGIVADPAVRDEDDGEDDGGDDEADAGGDAGGRQRPTVGADDERTW